MRCYLLPPFLCSHGVSPQIDHGVNCEHEGDRVEMLVVTFDTSTPIFYVPSFLLSNRWRIIAVQMFANQ